MIEAVAGPGVSVGLDELCRVSRVIAIADDAALDVGVCRFGGVHDAVGYPLAVTDKGLGQLLAVGCIEQRATEPYVSQRGRIRIDVLHIAHVPAAYLVPL